jgi:hypothetical protein
VFRETITIDDQADAPRVISALREVAAQRLAADQLAVIDQVEIVVTDFATNGSKLAAIGSQFRAERHLSGQGYEITIRARFGSKRSILDRLTSAIRGK